MVRRGALVQCASIGHGLQSLMENLILMSLFVIAINGSRPTQTLSPHWARRFVCFPINLEEAFVKAPPLFRLPLMVSPGRRDQIDAILRLPLDKLLRLCIIPRVAQRDDSKQVVECGAASQVILVTSFAWC